jgi:hypothetical protein
LYHTHTRVNDLPPRRFGYDCLMDWHVNQKYPFVCLSHSFVLLSSNHCSTPEWIINSFFHVVHTCTKALLHLKICNFLQCVNAFSTHYWFYLYSQLWLMWIICLEYPSTIYSFRLWTICLLLFNNKSIDILSNKTHFF